MIGLALYNKQLIVPLCVGLAIGLLTAGLFPANAAVDRPATARSGTRWVRERWLWAGVGLALLLGAPNVGYQATHDWPQLAMAGAIAETDGEANRIAFVPLQLLLFGPPLVPIWVAGWLRLWRDPALRAFAVAYPATAALTLLSAGQGYYVFGLLALLFAAGCVAVERWLVGRRTRRAVIAGALGVNAVVSALVALPLVPVGALHATPLPEINEVTRESVGWPEFVDRIGLVHAGLPAAERAEAVLLTSNYGEAGALDRYGTALPGVYSGHNELWHRGPPPDRAGTAIAVGIPLDRLAGLFERCELAARIDNRYRVDNEERGAPVVVCRRPLAPWSTLWPRFQHYS